MLTINQSRPVHRYIHGQRVVLGGCAAPAQVVGVPVWQGSLGGVTGVRGQR